MRLVCLISDALRFLDLEKIFIALQNVRLMGQKFRQYADVICSLFRHPPVVGSCQQASCSNLLDSAGAVAVTTEFFALFPTPGHLSKLVVDIAIPKFSILQLTFKIVSIAPSKGAHHLIVAI